MSAKKSDSLTIITENRKQKNDPHQVVFRGATENRKMRAEYIARNNRSSEAR